MQILENTEINAENFEKFNIKGILEFIVKSCNYWGYNPDNLRQMLSLWRKSYFGNIPYTKRFFQLLNSIQKEVREMIDDCIEQKLEPWGLTHPYSL